jgi:hypothetical protein
MIDTAVRECRLHFLRAAAKHPDIRLGDSLRKKVFEPERQRWAALGLPAPQKLSQDWTHEQYDALPSFYDARSRLIGEWAASHNLDYEWVHEAARDALGWEIFPTDPFHVIPGYQPPQFLWTPWCFDHESERGYRRRTAAAFQRTLAAYIERVSAERRRYLNHRFSHDSHYHWAVEHVCLGRRFSDIARETRNRKLKATMTRQAIRNAVLPILERIGIPPRDNPRKAKNSTS